MDVRTEDPTAPPVNPSARDAPSQEAVDEQESPGEAFHTARRRLEELGEYASYFISAKTDALKLTFRNIAIYAALGVVGLLAAGALIVTCVVLVVRGIAEALSTLFGGRVWLGDIAAGVLLLAVIGLGAWMALSRMTKGSRERTVKKYVARQQQQRARFGQDVCQRAQDPAK